MLFYVGRRLGMTLAVVLLVAFLVFGLLSLTPGDPAMVIAGDQATPEQLDAVRRALGLDQPFLVRFMHWFGEMLDGNLGVSIFSNEPVIRLIVQRAGATLTLLCMSLAMALLLAIPLGVQAAARPGGVADRAFTVTSVLSFSTPVFVVGYVLDYVFASQLRWLPVQGYVSPADDLAGCLRHLLLPSLTLGLAYASLVARITRSTMRDVLSRDFIRTALAKGVSRRGILYRHGLRNAAIPTVTVIGSGIAALIAGSVITETVFAIPGLGRLTVDAVLHRDYPVIQGVVLVVSAVQITINLMVDLSYVLLDPRIRYWGTK